MLPAIVTVADLDPATLTVVANKVVAQDPTKAPAAITATVVTAAPIASGDTVDLAISKLQAQVNNGTGGGGNFKQTIGNNVSLTYNVTHGLGTTDIAVTVFVISSGLTVYPGVVRLSTTVVRIDFSAAIPTNSHRVLIQSLG